MRTKTFSYLINDGSEDKNAKGKKKWVIKSKINFEDYRSYLEATQPHKKKFNYITKKDIKEYNPNWPQFLDYPYTILIIGGSGSGKTNSLLSLMNHQQDIDNIYLYARHSYKAKHKFLISKRESNGLKDFKDPKAVIEKIWMIFIKILKNIIWITNVKYW